MYALFGIAVFLLPCAFIRDSADTIITKKALNMANCIKIDLLQQPSASLLAARVDISMANVISSSEINECSNMSARQLYHRDHLDHDEHSFGRALRGFWIFGLLIWVWTCRSTRSMPRDEHGRERGRQLLFK